MLRSPAPSVSSQVFFEALIFGVKGQRSSIKKNFFLNFFKIFFFHKPAFFTLLNESAKLGGAARGRKNFF